MLLVNACVAETANLNETATLKMRFVFDGHPPPQKQIGIPLRFAPPKGLPTDEHLLVDPESSGIKNVLVYVYTGRGGSELVPSTNRTPKTRRMIMADGRFAPHILVAQAGDTLEIIERGPNQHNPNPNFFANSPQGAVVPPGKPWIYPDLKAEPALIPVGCNIHPWMSAYVAILDHPFAATSDSEGNLTIEGLPAGTSLVFGVFHEAGKIDRVKMSGADVEWPRGKFEVDLAVGMNDLGDILVPSASLDP